MVTTYLQKLVGVLFFSLLFANIYAQDQRVTELPVATSPDQDDVLYFIQDNVSTQIYKNRLFEETSDSLATVTSTASTNATNISSNSVSISTNATDIASLEDSIAKHTDTLQVHQDQIAALYDTTAIHLDTLQDHNTRLLSLEGETNLWTRTGTDLSPTTSGDDILLTDDTERLTFSDGDSYIYEPGDDFLRINVGGTNSMAFTLTEIGIYDRLVPGITKTTDIGSSLYFFRSGYFDTLFIDNTSTYLDVSGSNMTFTDATTGTKTLAELAASGGVSDSSWTSITVDTIDGLNTDAQIIFTDQENPFIQFWSDGNKTIEFQGEGAIFDVYTTFNNRINVDTIRFNDDNTEIWEDGSSNLSFKDAVTGTKTLAELAASSTADSSWTSITVDTVEFGDADTYIYESSDDVLDIYASGSQSWRFVNGPSTAYHSINPDSDDNNNLGTSSLRWDGIWATRYNVWASGIYIAVDGGGTNLTLTDGVTGTKTLDELANGTYFSGALTDGAPTDAEIDSVTGTTPAAVGAGWKCTILDTTGSSLIYIIVSDGTNWQYTALTIAT